MKIQFFKAALILSIALGSQFAYGQGMGVNTSGSTADASSMLDVSSTSKGLLTPRMTAAQRTAISSPAVGLLVYQTDAPEGFYFKSATAWTKLSTGGSVPAYADFYAQMPPDNAANVAPGADVQFPQNGPSAGGVSRVGSSAFTFTTSGDYQVSFQVSVIEAGQLQICINGVGIGSSIAGRATGTTQITGVSIVSITAGDILTIRNPSGNPSSLTLAPLAGGTNPVSAHLVITKLN